MSKEQFIKGKHDDGKHDGRYSNVKREQEAKEQLKELAILPKRDTIKPQSSLPEGVAL